MKHALARLAFLLLTGATAASGAMAWWSWPSAFPPSHASFWALSGAALLVLGVSIVAAFAPFDRPESAPNWAAPMAGCAGGLALAGLALFPATFLWLAGPLLVYAVVLLKLSAVIARESGAHPPPSAPPTEAADDELGPAPPPELEPPAPSPLARTSVRLEVILFALAGATLAWLWRPPAEGARPLPLDAAIAPITTRPTTRVRPRRVKRDAELVEVSGGDVRVHIGLRRPRIVAQLAGQTIVIEPCLRISEGSVDGFFELGPLNGYRLEPQGLALVDFEEGPREAWVRAAYPEGSARYGRLSGVAPFLGRRAGPQSIRATIEVQVDLRERRIVIDATTHLELPAAARRASLLWVRLLDVPPDPILLGLEEGVQLVPRPRRGPDPLQLLVDQGDRVELLRARSGERGPYERLAMGKFADWMLLPGKAYPLLLVAPDWRAQASRQPARNAGHGLRENAVIASYSRDRESQQGAINVVFDLASGRVGASRLCSELPAGVYRNRIVLRAVRRGDPAELAAAELAAMEAAARAPGIAPGAPPGRLAPAPALPGLPDPLGSAGSRRSSTPRD